MIFVYVDILCMFMFCCMLIWVSVVCISELSMLLQLVIWLVVLVWWLVMLCRQCCIFFEMRFLFLVCMCWNVVDSGFMYWCNLIIFCLSRQIGLMLSLWFGVNVIFLMLLILVFMRLVILRQWLIMQLVIVCIIVYGFNCKCLGLVFICLCILDNLLCLLWWMVIMKFLLMKIMILLVLMILWVSIIDLCGMQLMVLRMRNSVLLQCFNLGCWCVCMVFLMVNGCNLKMFVMFCIWFLLGLCSLIQMNVFCLVSLILCILCSVVVQVYLLGSCWLQMQILQLIKVWVGGWVMGCVFGGWGCVIGCSILGNVLNFGNMLIFDCGGFDWVVFQVMCFGMEFGKCQLQLWGLDFRCLFGVGVLVLI